MNAPEQRPTEVSLYNNGREATRANNLPEFFQELIAADQQATQQGTRKPAEADFFPVRFPPRETMEENEVTRLHGVIRDKLVTLFVATLRGITTQDGTPLMRNYLPMPNETHPYFDEEDVAIAVDDARRLMDPQDPDFQCAVADREVGAILLFGQVIDFIEEHGDVKAALKYLQIFSRPVTVGTQPTIGLSPGGDLANETRLITKPITELPWEEDDEVPDQKGPFRSNVLKNRLQAMENATYKVKNGNLIAGLNARFKEDKRMLELLADLKSTFETSANRLKASERNMVQWFNVLLSSISGFVTPQNSADCFECLDQVLRLIIQAASLRDLASTIQTFSHETLPSVAGAEAEKTTSSEPAQD